MTTKMKNVRSMFIAAIGYNETEKHLTIRMRNGKGYRYYGVSKNRFTRFLRASSKGFYFTSHIKGKFQMRRLKERYFNSHK